MDTELNDLKRSWQAGKQPDAPAPQADALIEIAKKHKASSIRFQYGNILILTITLLVVGYWFRGFLISGNSLSKAGYLLMMVPLLIRILAEAVSIRKAKNIAIEDSALQHNRASVAYVAFRKWMHGQVTITIMVLYTIGYYCILPQFASFIPAWLNLLLVVAYPIAALLIIWQVRKGIAREMADLQQLAAFETDMQA